MSIKGERQGLITSGASSESSMGAKWQEHHENEILVYGYSGEILNAGGKREHQPLVILKETDKTTPLLLTACATGEHLTECNLKLYRINIKGEFEHYYTIVLRDAVVCSMVTRSSDCREQEETTAQGNEESVGFRYRKIECRHEAAGTFASDIWDESGVAETKPGLTAHTSSANQKSSTSYPVSAEAVDQQAIRSPKQESYYRALETLRTAGSYTRPVDISSQSSYPASQFHVETQGIEHVDLAVLSYEEAVEFAENQWV